MVFDELHANYEPRLAAAFREVIGKIRSSVVMPPVIERLERGEVNGAVQTV